MIKINLDKAKVIAHDIRRRKREEEFKPHDEVIMKQIPGKDYQLAEQSRQAIRDKYADVQTKIDNTTDVKKLEAIVKSL